MQRADETGVDEVVDRAHAHAGCHRHAQVDERTPDRGRRQIPAVGAVGLGGLGCRVGGTRVSRRRWGRGRWTCPLARVGNWCWARCRCSSRPPLWAGVSQGRGESGRVNQRRVSQRRVSQDRRNRASGVQGGHEPGQGLRWRIGAQRFGARLGCGWAAAVPRGSGSRWLRQLGDDLAQERAEGVRVRAGPVGRGWSRRWPPSRHRNPWSVRPPRQWRRPAWCDRHPARRGARPGRAVPDPEAGSTRWPGWSESPARCPAGSPRDCPPAIPG